ncbi:MAG: hypothetical protein IT370_23940 [Deltaproteobacteria bacterium]|nr:hypothetical protein [Deltaproteobacteria bacterium]
MRVFRDVHGTEVTLVELCWRQTYAFWEGSPRLANIAILGNHLDRDTARWGDVPRLVVGHDQRRDGDRLPPARVLCLLTSTWLPPGAAGSGRTHLVLGWFGDDGDPFDQLAKILAGLSWRDHAAYHRVD